MLPLLNSTSMQMEMNYHEPACDNLEEYAQKHGVVVVLPTLHNRIAFRAGQILITIGKKLTAANVENQRLSGETA